MSRKSFRMKKTILLDPAFRKLDEIFEPADLRRLNALANVIWGQDEPMPADNYASVQHDAFAIITGRWRYGAVADWPKRHAILEVGGRHPSPKVLDYPTCFARGIRVLRLGARELRALARQRYGYDIPERALPRHRHLLNVYVPRWDGAVLEG